MAETTAKKVVHSISTEVDPHVEEQTPEQKLADFLIKQLVRVGSVEINMAQAKQDLSNFWKALPKEERQILYDGNKAISVATKVKQMAESLTSEIPGLLGQFSRGD